MKLPTEQDYAALYRTYHTPEHIQDHMQMVAEITRVLAEARLAVNDAVDIELAVAAALLHDLVRIPEQWPYLPTSISTPLPHAEINYLLLRDRYPEIAEVIRSHSLMTIFENQALSKIESQLVYYADKRVNHADIVSLEDRIVFGKQRWRVDPATDNSDEIIQKLKQLEQSLFDTLTIQPEDLHAITTAA